MLSVRQVSTQGSVQSEVEENRRIFLRRFIFDPSWSQGFLFFSLKLRGVDSQRGVREVMDETRTGRWM